MRCPWCGHADDKVVDSRASDGGGAIRRRRECLGCNRRFTTFERVEAVSLTVVKRDGAKEPFDKAKVVSGVMKAIKNRPVTDEQVQKRQVVVLGPRGNDAATLADHITRFSLAGIHALAGPAAP